jgi:hypothetical protein
MNLRIMKLMLVAVGAATVFANPAFAKKHTLATETYAMASEGAYTVIGWDGRIVGADPDRKIRFQLMRDAFANEN